MAAVAIRVDGLTKRYGDLLAVDAVSFDVGEGEIFGVIGPNGSGKTTTVECVQGLRRPDAGAIRVVGLDPRREAVALRRVVGSQLQESALPDRIKVREALALFASTGPGAGRWQDQLERWGLADKRDATFASLSGGQRQRLFIALALVHDPRVVFLDEMTTGLDPAARRLAWDLLEDVRADGTTVVLVTHFMDEAERLCDRLAVFRDGRIVAADAPAGLVAALGGETVVRVRLPALGEPPRLDRVPGVRQVERQGDLLTVSGEGTVAAHVGHALVAAGCEPLEFHVREPSLEDVVLRLVGRDVSGS